MTLSFIFFEIIKGYLKNLSMRKVVFITANILISIKYENFI